MFEKILYNSNSITKACSVLKDGGIIVYPTDTIYGFGCDGKNDDAIKKLNTIKNRSGPISVLCPNINKALEWINLSNKSKNIVKDKLISKSTVIVPVKENIASKLIKGKHNTLGLRMSKHPFCKNLTDIYPNPITSTSVNRKGGIPLTNPTIIAEEFSKDINLLIEDGVIEGPGSKIYLFSKNGWKVLR